MAGDVTTPGGSGTVNTEKTEKRVLSNDDKVVSNLEQHILSQNIDKVQNFYTANQDLFNYLTFRQINGPASQIVNKLRGIDNVDVFYKIKTSVLSLMQPKIRIYKVNYEEPVFGADGTLDSNKVVALASPCYKEFKFSDHFGQETAASVQDYLAYESTRPSWRNVGLKSFSVNQNGESYGIIENNIDCKLQLTFKSLKDLQASPPGEPPTSQGGLRYVDLITWAPSRIDRETETYNPKHYEIKVLLGYTAPSPEQLSFLNLSSDDIRNIANIEKMNTIIGLSLTSYDINIKEDGQIDLTADYRGRIETVVGSNQANIFQSTFRITEGGAVSISKKVDSDHNISRVSRLITQIGTIHKQIKSPECKDANCEARSQARSLVVDDSFFQLILGETGINPDKVIAGGDETIYELFRSANVVKHLINTIKKKIGLFKKEAYKSFVDQLITGNDIKDGTGTRLFCINAGIDTVRDSMGIVLDDLPGVGITEPEETNNIQEADNIGSATTAIPKGKQGVVIDRCHRADPVDPAIANNVAQDISAAIDESIASKDKKTGDKKKDDARKTTLNFNLKSHKFYFVFLGDLIELACKNSGMGTINFEGFERDLTVFRRDSYYPVDLTNTSRDYMMKNMRILLGPVEYIDSQGAIKRINLAQFPISFNFFRAWFIRKIVRKKRTQMSLGNFLTLLINHLVIPAMGVGMPSSIRTPRTRANFINLSLPGKQLPGTTDERVCGRRLGKIDELLPKERIINIKSSKFDKYDADVKKPISSESIVKTSFDYLLIYISTSKDITERRGDPIEDIKDGIYHFNIGSDMGLLRDMSFSKQNIPFLKEMRAEEAESQGVDQLEQLKFPYNTDLNLIGTSLFTPGMFYYVNPSLAGLGSVESAGSLAYQMNLGGYHLIGQVNTTITPGKFETKIIGTQTSQGRR